MRGRCLGGEWDETARRLGALSHLGVGGEYGDGVGSKSRYLQLGRRLFVRAAWTETRGRAARLARFKKEIVAFPRHSLASTQQVQSYFLNLIYYTPPSQGKACMQQKKACHPETFTCKTSVPPPPASSNTTARIFPLWLWSSACPCLPLLEALRHACRAGRPEGRWAKKRLAPSLPPNPVADRKLQATDTHHSRE